MSEATPVGRHYGRGDLFETILAALEAAGIDPEAITADELAQFDHFHTRGLAATRELADRLDIAPEHHVLDIGSGIGGPARFLAARYGCRVTGIDLTEEFCAVARRLNQMVGLDERIEIRQGDACALPFAEAAFDRALAQNVAMNIADKARYYAEAFRVLKPGGLLATSEMTLGDGPAPLFPVPWSSDGSGSHLQSAEETRAAMARAGFEVVDCWDQTAAANAANQAMAELIAREGPPKLGRHILMGPDHQEKARNIALNVAEGRVRPVDFLCRKPAA